MSYRTIFREAVGEIPPTSIDMDRLIAGQRRARRLRRVGVAATAAAAVVAVIVGATAVTGRPRADVPAAPSPTVRTPAPSEGDSFTPTDMAIFEAVGRVAPDLEWAPRRGAVNAEPEWHSSPATSGYTPSAYMGQGRVRSGDRAGDLVVQIDDDWGSLSPCTADAVSRNGCTMTTGPAGEKIRATSARNPAREPDRSPSGISVSRTVMVERADRVVLIVSIKGEDENPPLTIGQLTALALDPAVAARAAQPFAGDPEARRRWIDSRVLASLQRQVPGVTGAEGRGAQVAPADLGAFWGAREGASTRDSYSGQGRVLVKGVVGLFSVRVDRQAPGSPGDLACGGSTGTAACTEGAGPNGERYRTTHSGSGASAVRTVHVLRADGSWLVATLTADPQGRFALSAAQQQAVASDPAVALVDW